MYDLANSVSFIGLFLSVLIVTTSFTEYTLGIIYIIDVGVGVVAQDYDFHNIIILKIQKSWPNYSN